MTIPPIMWCDAVALGVNPSASIALHDSQLVVTPPAPQLVTKLLAAAMASPPPSPHDNRMAYLRHVRDLIIGLTDWTQAPDSPLTVEQRAAWALYRQSLRDLPARYAGDGPIPWPQCP